MTTPAHPHGWSQPPASARQQWHTDAAARDAAYLAQGPTDMTETDPLGWLAEATASAELARHPDGAHTRKPSQAPAPQPKMPHVLDARTRLIRAALMVLSAQLADEGPDADAQAEYAEDTLALAARDLTHAVDTLPAERWPVGWQDDETAGDGKRTFVLAVRVRTQSAGFDYITDLVPQEFHAHGLRAALRAAARTPLPAWFPPEDPATPADAGGAA